MVEKAKRKFRQGDLEDATSQLRKLKTAHTSSSVEDTHLLFAAAFGAAVKISTFLDRTRQAVKQQHFDRGTFEGIQAYVAEQLYADPIHIFAADYWAKQGEEFPTIDTGKEATDDGRNQVFGNIYRFEGRKYTSSAARVLQLLLGATPEYPLSTDDLISLSTPQVLSYTANFDAIKDSVRVFHRDWEIVPVPPLNERDDERYFMRRKVQPEVSERTVSDIESKKPLLHIVIGAENTGYPWQKTYNLLTVNGEQSHLGSSAVRKRTRTQAFDDALRILEYLCETQGKMSTHAEILSRFKDIDVQYRSKSYLSSRVDFAKRFLANHLRFDNKSIITVRQTTQTMLEMGIMEYDVNLEIKPASKLEEKVIFDNKK